MDSLEGKTRAGLAAMYFLIILAVGVILFTLPLLWITFTLSTVFLYIACLFLIHFLELKTEKLPVVTKWPTLTVLIPAYNRGESLHRCLEKVKGLDYPRKIQIIVINDGSTDDTFSFLKKQKGIEVITNPRPGGKGHALNQALKKAKGELIAVVDGDSYPESDCLVRMIPNFYAAENVGSVTSIVRVNNRTGLLQKIQEIEYSVGFGLYNTVLSSLDSLFVTPGPLSIYTRKALDATGGFDETNITEDMEITFHLHKLGYKIRMEPEAHVYSDVPETISQLYRQRLRWTRGGFQTAYKYRKDFLSTQKMFFRFFFPLRLLMEFTSLLFLFLIVRMGLQSLQGLQDAFWTLSLISFEAFPIPQFNITASTIYYVLMLGITLALVIFGAQALRKNTPKISIPAILVFVFVYGVFIISVYFISLTKMFLGARQKW